MACLAGISLWLTAFCVGCAFSLLVTFLGKWIAQVLPIPKAYRQAQEEVNKLEARLAQMSVAEARQLADKLLSDPEHFNVTASSGTPPSELLLRLGPEAREFLGRYDSVTSMPLGDTTIGGEWAKETRDYTAIAIGGGEFVGNLHIRLGEEKIYSDVPPNDVEPLAMTIHHLIILLASGEGIDHVDVRKK